MPDNAIEGSAEIDGEAGNALLKRIEIGLNGCVNKAAQLIEARTNRAKLLLAVSADWQKLRIFCSVQAWKGASPILRVSSPDALRRTMRETPFKKEGDVNDSIQRKQSALD